MVVLCPDRLARNYVHQALVLEELSRFGVSVIFLEGGLADSPHGRLIAQVQAAVAEFERTKIVERNRRGKLWRARQGAIVSGDVPFGYRKVPASDGLPPRLEIRQEQAAVVRQVFNWHANDGLSVRQIAIRLMEAGVPSPRGNRIWRTSSLDRLLHNEAYTGTMYFNRYSDLPARRSASSPRPRAPTHPIRAASGGMDRGQRARHHRSRHLDSLPNTRRRQRPLQSPPRWRAALPTAISRPVWRMRRGSPLWRPHPGRPRGPLLPLPEHPPPPPT